MDTSALTARISALPLRVRVAAALVVVLASAVAVWAHPVPTRIVWSGPGETTITRRIPAAVQVPQVLDQWDDPVEHPAAAVLALDPPELARLEDGLLVPLRSGTVRVVARIGKVLGAYEVTLSLPPDLEGRWVTRATTGDIERTTFVTARLRQPELYDVVLHVLDRRGDDLRQYLARNTLRIDGSRACLDNPVLIPPDAPLPATSRCDALTAEGTDAVRLTAPDGTPRVWRRPSLEDWDILHAVVARDLDLLREAQFDWRGKFGVFLPVSDEATAQAQATQGPRRTTPDVNAVRMGAQSTCCVSLGGLRAVVDGDHLRVHASLDADSDGIPATWVGTETQPATRTSAPDVR